MKQIREGNSELMSDITDGELYKQIVKKFLLHNNHDFATIIFNSDGVPVFNSSTLLLWPVEYNINETPIHVRNSKQITAGY